MVDNIHIGIIIGQGRRRTVSALEESVIFTVSYTQQTIALPERQGWCDSSLLHIVNWSFTFRLFLPICIYSQLPPSNCDTE